MQEFDFANAANWEQISYTLRFAENPSSGFFVPIPEANVTGPFPLNSPIIASHATSASAKPTWNTAGWLYQNVRTGILVGGLPDAAVQGSRRVPLGRVQIHFWDRKMKNYQLSFKTPKWITQMALTLWQYTGPISEPDLEAIDLTRIDILRTEAKVDALFKEMGER